MPKVFPTEIVQPLGLHNKPYPCVHTKHISDYLSLNYDYLNPIQSDFVNYLEDDEKNIIVASPTSSGKTVIAELFIARALKIGKKALYTAPMKALADEKYYDWTNLNHTFSKYEIEILTGDFEITKEKAESLNKSDIIILTPEMFNSKCRNFSNFPWLGNSWYIEDEAHLIGLSGRGDACEVGIIQYFENRKDSRALLLSATLPNVNDFGVWLNHMTGRESIILSSDYRPCKLNKEFVPFQIKSYNYSNRYEDIEKCRMEKVIKIIEENKHEPIIVFVGSKMFGTSLCKELEKLKINHKYHNADLERDERRKIEEGFRNNEFNVIVATTTVAWGCLSSDTTVSTEDGYYNIYNSKKVISVNNNIDAKEKTIKITKIVADNKIEMKRIITSSGLSIACTEDHVFPTKIKEKKAIDLNTEDYLYIEKPEQKENINFINKVGKYDENFFYILGIMTGDEYEEYDSLSDDMKKFILIDDFGNKYLDYNLINSDIKRLKKIISGLLYSCGTRNENKIIFSNKSYNLCNFYVLYMKKIGIKTKCIMNNGLLEIHEDGEESQDMFVLEKINYILKEKDREIVYDLSMANDNERYIANGIVVHNCNFPAKHVIQCHTKFGIKDMHPSGIIQAIGRAGRAGWSDKGEAHIVCIDKDVQKENKRIFQSYKIESTLNDVNTLMFHIISYIVDGKIKTKDDLIKWYQLTLSSIQKNHITEETASSVLKNLCSRGMIKENNGQYEATRIGKITARMYMSPLDVSDWFINFSKIKEIISKNKLNNENINLDVAVCLSGCYSYGLTWKVGLDGKYFQAVSNTIYANKVEKSSPQVLEIGLLTKKSIEEYPHLKYTSIFYNLLNGKNIDPKLNSTYMTIYRDFDRIISTLKQCDNEFGKFLNNKGRCSGFGWGYEWDSLLNKMKYGVSDDLIELVNIPNIGKTRAEKLKKHGIISKKQLFSESNKEICIKALGPNIYKKIIN